MKLTRTQIAALEAVKRGEVFLDCIRHDKQNTRAESTMYSLTDAGRAALEEVRK